MISLYSAYQRDFERLLDPKQHDPLLFGENILAQISKVFSCATSLVVFRRLGPVEIVQGIREREDSVALRYSWIDAVLYNTLTCLLDIEKKGKFVLEIEITQRFIRLNSLERFFRKVQPIISEFVNHEALVALYYRYDERRTPNPSPNPSPPECPPERSYIPVSFSRDTPRQEYAVLGASHKGPIRSSKLYPRPRTLCLFRDARS